MDTNLVALLWWGIGTILLCYLTAIVAAHVTNKSWAKAAEHDYYHAFNKRIYKVMIFLEDISLSKKLKEDNLPTEEINTYLCHICNKKMPRLWETICIRCQRPTCYAHVKDIDRTWVCFKCLEWENKNETSNNDPTIDNTGRRI